MCGKLINRLHFLKTPNEIHQKTINIGRIIDSGYEKWTSEQSAKSRTNRVNIPKLVTDKAPSSDVLKTQDNLRIENLRSQKFLDNQSQALATFLPFSKKVGGITETDSDLKLSNIPCLKTTRKLSQIQTPGDSPKIDLLQINSNLQNLSLIHI